MDQTHEIPGFDEILACDRPFGINQRPVRNRLLMDEGQLLVNLQAMQRTNQLTVDGKLQGIEEEIRTTAGTIQARFPNYSVERTTISTKSSWGVRDLSRQGGRASHGEPARDSAVRCRRRTTVPEAAYFHGKS